MLPADAKVMQDRLNELAEVFDKKPVGEKGLTVWFSVLREFPTEKVCGVLIGWPKTHTKFPAPSEVWKAVNDIQINEREKRAEQENKAAGFEPGVGGEQAEKFIAQMRVMLKKPKWTPREHWERVLSSQPEGSIGHRYASEALLKMGARTAPAVMEREPGQDDEERDAA